MNRAFGSRLPFNKLPARFVDASFLNANPGATIHGAIGGELLLGGLLFAAVLLAGCSGENATRKKPPPDQRYGHRYAGTDPAGRTTLGIEPPRSNVRYSYYDVPVSEVIVRAASFDKGEDAVPVELLIKGALPNDCLALHEAERERSGHFLSVTFTMRWPPTVECERLERPYRFYLPLEGRFEPGDYTLKLNGAVYPFTVRRK